MVSVVNIDPGKTSPWGNVVSPGVLAQNHQHIFAIRIDPAIDGHENTVITEESLPIPMNPKTNPWGNGYEVVRKPVTKSTSIHASPFTNLAVKIANTNKLNPVSQRPVAYKFTPNPTQLMLADPQSIVAKRAAFAHHHVWVTKYKDEELFAAGEFTNQSKLEIGGVADAVARNEDVENKDVVVWNVFGLTQSPGRRLAGDARRDPPAPSQAGRLLRPKSCSGCTWAEEPCERRGWPEWQRNRVLSRECHQWCGFCKWISSGQPNLASTGDRDCAG